MSTAARYLTASGLFVVVCVLAVALLNLTVDPYGFHRWVDVRGFNAVKPRAGQQVARNKAYGITEHTPVVLLLGNSRVEVGLDPASPHWPAGMTVYNAGIPGSGMATTLQYMEHALAHGPVKLAVIGLEFLDFLDSPVATETHRSTNEAPDLTSFRWQLGDTRNAVLSLDAALDSVVTVLGQRNPNAPDISPDGFNPSRDYAGHALREGYAALFLQRNLENAKSYARKPRRLEARGTNPGPSWTALARLRDICSSGSMQCHFFIYPYHADVLEMFAAAGLWPLFEEWKAALAVQLAPRAGDGPPGCALWDFSGHHRYATERVPARGDRASTMQWYWEAGHFKASLGERMIERMQGGTDDFGSRLTPANVARHVADLRARRDRYVADFPEESRRVREVFALATGHY